MASLRAQSRKFGSFVMAENAPLLAMRGISKSFGPVRANDNVDLTLHRGDILGLLGENGAGKTTLMNVLFGAYAADSGTVEIDGDAVTIHNSADAISHGVGMVHQHFHLVLSHTVIENVMVGQKGKNGMLDRAGAEARLAQIGEEYSLKLEPDALVGDFTIGEQQRLEITLQARACGDRRIRTASIHRSYGTREVPESAR